MSEQLRSKITEEQAEKVAGGAGENTTFMSCSQCTYTTYWWGNYEGGVYNCPECGGVNSLVGGAYTGGGGTGSGGDVFIS